jgi:Peptidase family M23
MGRRGKRGGDDDGRRRIVAVIYDDGYHYDRPRRRKGISFSGIIIAFLLGVILVLSSGYLGHDLMSSLPNIPGLSRPDDRTAPLKGDTRGKPSDKDRTCFVIQGRDYPYYKKRGRIGPYGMRTLTNNGRTTTRMHNGIDLSDESGTVLVAPENGRVIEVSHQYGSWNEGIVGAGIYLVFVPDSNQEKTFWYFHLDSQYIVKGDKGDGKNGWKIPPNEYHKGLKIEVEAGDPLALMGNTGYSSGPHLHYEVRTNNVHEDPANYLKGLPACGPETTSSPPQEGQALGEVAKRLLKEATRQGFPYNNGNAVIILVSGEEGIAYVYSNEEKKVKFSSEVKTPKDDDVPWYANRVTQLGPLNDCNGEYKRPGCDRNPLFMGNSKIPKTPGNARLLGPIAISIRGDPRFLVHGVPAETEAELQQQLGENTSGCIAFKDNSTLMKVYDSLVSLGDPHTKNRDGPVAVPAYIFYSTSG